MEEAADSVVAAPEEVLDQALEEVLNQVVPDIMADTDIDIVRTEETTFSTV